MTITSIVTLARTLLQVFSVLVLRGISCCSAGGREEFPPRGYYCSAGCLTGDARLPPENRAPAAAHGKTRGGTAGRAEGGAGCAGSAARRCGGGAGRRALHRLPRAMPQRRPQMREARRGRPAPSGKRRDSPLEPARHPPAPPAPPLPAAANHRPIHLHTFAYRARGLVGCRRAPPRPPPPPSRRRSLRAVRRVPRREALRGAAPRGRRPSP